MSKQSIKKLKKFFTEIEKRFVDQDMPSKKVQYSLKPKSNTYRTRLYILSSSKFEVGEEDPENMKLDEVSA